MSSIQASVSSIKWDTDEPEELESLPTQMTVTVQVDSASDDEEIDEAISDAITNETGFCHKGFSLDALTR